MMNGAMSVARLDSEKRRFADDQKCYSQRLGGTTFAILIDVSFVSFPKRAPGGTLP